MSVDLVFDNYDVRKRIGQRAFSRKRGSTSSKGGLFQPAPNSTASWKKMKEELKIASQSRHQTSKKASKKEQRLSVEQCPSSTDDHQGDDEDARVLRKLETKMNRQAEKAMRRARGGRQPARKSPKGGERSSRSNFGVDEDFSLPTVHEYHDYDDDNYNAQDYFYGYEAAFDVEQVPTETESEYNAAGWDAENQVVSTCQTKEEWQAEQRHVQWDATADRDDAWLNPEALVSADLHASSKPIATRDDDELSCGCTEVSVCLSEAAAMENFVVLDETALLQVLNAEAQETEDREARALAEWELIDDLV